MAFNVSDMRLARTREARIFETSREPAIHPRCGCGSHPGADNNIYVYFGQQANRAMPSLVNLISLTGQTIGAPALALFYMATLTLLAERASWRRRLAPLANAGRMALTNYLAADLHPPTVALALREGRTRRILLMVSLFAAGGAHVWLAAFAG
jgi:uncharacterized membrane protein YeiB